MKQAEEKKQNVRNKVKLLREQFAQLKSKNIAQQEVLRVSDQELFIDPDYFDQLLLQNEEKIKVTRNEVHWSIAYHKKRLDKLREKFYDNLDYERFMVKSLKT